MAKFKEGDITTLIRIDEFTAEDFVLSEEEFADLLKAQGGEVIIDCDSTGDGMYFDVICMESSVVAYAISEYHLAPLSSN